MLITLTYNQPNGATQISEETVINARCLRHKWGILMAARDDVNRKALQWLLQGRHDETFPWINHHAITDNELATGDGGLVFAKPVPMIYPRVRGGIKNPSGPGFSWLWLWLPD